MNRVVYLITGLGHCKLTCMTRIKVSVFIHVYFGCRTTLSISCVSLTHVRLYVSDVKSTNSIVKKVVNFTSSVYNVNRSTTSLFRPCNGCMN